jgi:hypothetical protein
MVMCDYNPSTWKAKQEDGGFEVSLDNIARPRLKKKKKKKREPQFHACSELLPRELKGRAFHLFCPPHTPLSCWLLLAASFRHGQG